MLNQVPTAINLATRRVTLRHPNAIPCVVHRKVHLRDGEPAFGSLPTIGGMGVISGEDELEYRWEPLGEGRLLFAPAYAGFRGNMTRSNELLNYAPEPVEALIECLAEPGTTAHFLPDRGMLVQVLWGGGVIQNFRIVDVTGNVNIPPYTRRYVLDPNADLDDGQVIDDGQEGPGAGAGAGGEPDPEGAEEFDPLAGTMGMGL